MKKDSTHLMEKIESHLQSLKKQIKLMEKQHSDTLLLNLEMAIQGSIRWKIGTFIVVNIKRILNLLKNPIRFFRDKDYRIVERRKRIKPATETAKTSFSLNKQVQVSDIIKQIDHVIAMLNTPAFMEELSDESIVLNDQPIVGVILDEFTNACLQPELDAISFKTDNWKETLESRKPQALFIESAWHGNMGSWQYRIAKYQKNMGEELLDLLAWAKNQEIPSIFWNKEDPPNFERFIDKAKLFDYIFTSDENCIQAYSNHIAHNRIFSLPFAAQPKIHNPVLDEKRLYNVCFAGTYHSDEYYERRNDMEILLKPAMEHGLHIYDRNFGATSPGSERFRFPEIYQPFIKGRLNYTEMLRAYRQYKVFLNVNSVKDSPTMFSRRVFELMACGTPVISTYSKGIVDLLGDTVLITESETDTKKHLEFLLNDPLIWEKTSVRGIRKVLENHTYAKRMKHVLETVGLQYNLMTPPRVCVFACINSPDEVQYLIQSLVRQSYRPSALVIFSESLLKESLIDQIKNKIQFAAVYNYEFALNNIHGIISDSVDANYFAVFNSEDYYGSDYLKDYSLATLYSSANCFGKSTYWANLASKLTLKNPGMQFHLTQKVPMGSLFFYEDFLTSFNPLHLKRPDYFFESFVANVLSIDSLNYIRNYDGQTVPENVSLEVIA